ncbi:tetratricopeptide repeat protein [Desulfovibrio sp. OttesenSCG-928-A18]|nr:tetratricopeptide repeat protein [Desulfovibrio sp. OttesenSCG-928-A18]
MQYSDKDYQFLGKQVAAGRYVSRATLFLSLVLVLLLGMCLGRYLFPYNPAPGAYAGERRALGQAAAPGEAQQSSGLIRAVEPENQILQSIIEHEDSVRKNPENLEAWVHLGNLYYDAREPAKAVNAYNKALELKPDMPDVLVDCGVMYKALRQYDKALEYFARAIEYEPRHEYAHFNSGIVLFNDLHRKDEALAFWRKLVAINPNAKAPSGVLVSKIVQDLENE